MAYYFIIELGQNSDEGMLLLRAARIFVAVIVSLIIYLLINFIIDTIGWEDTQMSDPVITFLITGPPFLASFVILKRLHLYRN